VVPSRQPGSDIVALPAEPAQDRPRRTTSSQGNRKILLIVFLGTFLLFLVGYLALYRVIDPRSEFGTGIFPAPITNARQTKQDIFKRFLAQGPIDGLILGSSRTMMMDPASSPLANHRRFFNFGVENAMLEDDLAVYRWALQQGADPKILIVGLDVEAFDSANHIDDRLQSNARLLETVSPSAKNPLSIQRMRSNATVTSNALTVQSAIAMTRAIELKVKPVPQVAVVSEDGHNEFPVYEELVRTTRFDLPKAISETLPVYTGKYQNMRGLSEQRKQWLIDLIHDAQNHQCKVVLWITPLHPAMADVLEKSTPYGVRLQEVLAFLDHLPSQFPETVRVFDFSLPDRFGGTDDDWIDGAHMNKRNAGRAFDFMMKSGANGI